MRKLLAPHSQASTDQVPAHQRLAFWEAYNASKVNGLRCSTHAAEGLHASIRSYDLGEVRLTEIRGNQHVVERTPELLRTHPKNAIFACLLLEGEAFLIQAGQCVALESGDVSVYCTDRPYLYAFAGPMRQVIVEIDAASACETRGSHAPTAPLKLDHRLRSGRLMAKTLRRCAQEFVEQPHLDTVDDTAEALRAMLEVVLRHDATTQCSEGTAWRLTRAESFIETHLDDPRLDVAAVAHELGVSKRHANRIFAQRGYSVTQWIWERRLERARGDLASARLRSLDIGAIAARWGFANQAHFARAFKAHFGCTPSQYRRRAFGAVLMPG